jgi:hypothetical protein
VYEVHSGLKLMAQAFFFALAFELFRSPQPGAAQPYSES